MSLKNGTLFRGRKNLDNIQIGKKGLNNIQIGVIYKYKEYISSSNPCYCSKLVDRDELEIIIDGTKNHTETKIQELVDNGVLEIYEEEIEPKACMGCINSDICKHKSTVAKIEEQLGEDIKGAGISLQLVCNRKRSLAPNPTIDTPYTPYIGSVELCPRWDTTCPNFHNGRCLSQLGCTKDMEFLNIK